MKAVLDTLLPAPCLGCGMAVSGPLRLCPLCAATLSVIAPACNLCGTAQPAPGVCAGCAARPPRWKRRAVWRYGDVPAALMAGYKSRGLHALAGPLIDAALAADPEVRKYADGCDLVVAIPSPWWRRMQRGYNPAALLADALAGALDRPRARLALRKRRAVRQAGLTGGARRKLGRAFAPGPAISALRGKTILLVDDVETTGATLRAAALELRRAGVKEVRAVTLFRVTSER